MESDDLTPDGVDDLMAKGKYLQVCVVLKALKKQSCN